MTLINTFKKQLSERCEIGKLSHKFHPGEAYLIVTNRKWSFDSSRPECLRAREVAKEVADELGLKVYVNAFGVQIFPLATGKDLGLTGSQVFKMGAERAFCYVSTFCKPDKYGWVTFDGHAFAAFCDGERAEWMAQKLEN